jgi:predicted metal-dependent HD superfamily phosphohydrolase/quercetin dioxygenase-like cupin family protein
MSTLDRWFHSWAELGVPASARLEQVFADLLSRYSEPHRFYHTHQHLAECFETWADLLGQAERPAEVELAIWFHDAVYDTHSNTNEELSSELARDTAAGLGVDTASVRRIQNLIMSTRHADIPVDPDARLLVDTDLAILGADPARFMEYEGQIRQEYAWVPEEVFRERRAGLLQKFLERPYIFSTDLFRLRYEQQARVNIRRSLGLAGIREHPGAGRQEDMIRNFQSAPSAWGAAHEGKGQVKNALLYGDTDFSTNLRFVIYTELPPGTSIGYHTHGNDEEVYVILEGLGTMTIHGEVHEVRAGDVILNKPYGSHGLENTSSTVLKILVFEVQG